MSIVDKLVTIAENMPKVYKAGQNAGGGIEIDPDKILPTTVTGDGFVHLDDVSEVPHDITIQAAEGTKVSVIGKNLWNEQWVIGIYNDDTGDFYPSGNRLCVSPDNPIYVKGNTYYAFSNSGKAYFNIFWFDEKGVFLKFDYINKYQFALRSPTNAARLCFYMGVAYGQTYLNDIQIEEGAAWSPYEPFSATEITTPTTIKSVSPVMNFSTLPQNIPISINYNKSWGMNEAFKSFWNEPIETGDFTAFAAGIAWNNTTFNPPVNKITPIFANRFMYRTGIKNVKNVLEIDFSKCGTLYSGFEKSSIQELGVVDTKASRASETERFCHTCDDLSSVDNFISYDTTSWNGVFYGCPNLQHLIVTGVINKNVNLSQSPLLSKESIISIVNALSSTASGLAVTFSATAVNNALTTDEKNALFNTKSNWTISLV